IKNKGKQKQFYKDNNLPTADFQLFESTSNLKSQISNLTMPFVWKATEGGYDGNGVKVIRKIEDLSNLPETECIAETMIPIKNKGKQEQFYKDNNLPTADFQLFESTSNLKSQISNLTMPFVWKATEGGYDGNGVKVIRKIEDLSNLPETECIAETMIPFKNELAVIVARSASGEIKTYPVVEMEFHPEANQVEYVICPARIDE